jgi:hypothetical protein
MCVKFQKNLCGGSKVIEGRGQADIGCDDPMSLSYPVK